MFQWLIIKLISSPSLDVSVTYNQGWEFTLRFFERVFCEQKSKSAIRLFIWANRSGCSDQKSNVSKLLTVALWQKRGETVKNIQKMQFFGIFSSKSFVVGSELLTLFCQEQPERIAHGRSLIWAILSKRAKNKLANSQPCLKLKLISSPSLNILVTYIITKVEIFFFSKCFCD